MPSNLKLATVGILSLEHLASSSPRWFDYLNKVHADATLALTVQNSHTVSRYDHILPPFILGAPHAHCLLYRAEFTCGMQHLLFTCTHPVISTLHQEMTTNLGFRLMAQGASRWWVNEPRPSGTPLIELEPQTLGWADRIW